MARIGIAGFQHETNTFAPLQADLEAFATTPAYPRLPRGQAMIDEVHGLNLPIAGFIEAASAEGHLLVPSVWGMATPSSYVSDHAFDTITGMIVSDGDTVIIKCMGGLLQTIPKSKIQSRQAMKVSLMYQPQQLGLDAQAIADIAAFLKK